MIEFEYNIKLFENDEIINDVFWAENKIEAYKYLTSKYPTAISFTQIRPK